MGIISWLLFWSLPFVLKALKQPNALIPLMANYFHAISWGAIPYFLSTSCLQLFFPTRRGILVVYLSILNLILTLSLGTCLIFGYGGLPALGMVGWAYAVTAVNWFLFFIVLLFIALDKQYKTFQLFHFKSADMAGLKFFFKISFPITMQFACELLAFSALNVMVGWLGMQACSIQQILIQCSTVALMIPMGVGQACTMLISYAKGKKEDDKIRPICFSGTVLVLFSMFLIAMLYWLIPERIIALYIQPNQDNQLLIPAAVMMLGLIAFNQMADAVRNVVIASFKGVTRYLVSNVAQLRSPMGARSL